MYRYIGNRVAEAEVRLRLVKPPDFIGRIPKAFRGRGWKGKRFLVFSLHHYVQPFSSQNIPSLLSANSEGDIARPVPGACVLVVKVNPNSSVR